MGDVKDMESNEEWNKRIQDGKEWWKKVEKLENTETCERKTKLQGGGDVTLVETVATAFKW